MSSAGGAPRVAEAAAHEHFLRDFGREPGVVAWAPGRVNLIGDHTDTSEGYVLPIPIHLGVAVALRASGAPGGLRHPDPPPGWERYLHGVIAAAGEKGWTLPPIEGTVAADLPMGEGLGSSAALCVALVRALAAVVGEEISPREEALLAHRAESRYVGVACGIMDQFCSALGRPGEAMFLDTRTLEVRAAPLPPEVRIGVLPTGSRRELSESPYNLRREETAEAAARLGVASLRDLDPDAGRREVETLPSPYRERARHVLSENRRVLEAEAALHAGSARRLGQLLNDSHASLRDDFAVSTPELETVTEIARSRPGCLGARLTGAGFGGSAIALLEADRAGAVLAEIVAEFRHVTGRRTEAFLA